MTLYVIFFRICLVWLVIQMINGILVEAVHKIIYILITLKTNNGV